MDTRYRITTKEEHAAIQKKDARGDDPREAYMDFRDTPFECLMPLSEKMQQVNALLSQHKDGMTLAELRECFLGSVEHLENHKHDEGADPGAYEDTKCLHQAIADDIKNVLYLMDGAAMVTEC